MTLIYEHKKKRKTLTSIGFRLINYCPHRELGIVYLYQGNFLLYSGNSFIKLNKGQHNQE